MSNQKSEARTVEEYCAAHEDDFVLCRDVGHAWPKKIPKGYVNTDGAGGRNPIFSKRIECERCGVVKYRRVQRIGNSYERINATYEYPDGYLTAHIGMNKEDMWRYLIEGEEEAPKPKAKRKSGSSRRLRSVS